MAHKIGQAEPPEDHHYGDRRKRPFEQTVTTIATSLTVAILLWVGSTILGMSKEVEKINGQMLSLVDKYATKLELESIKLAIQRIDDEQKRRAAFIPGYRAPKKETK